jgi:hypothetical protein
MVLSWKGKVVALAGTVDMKQVLGSNATKVRLYLLVVLHAVYAYEPHNMIHVYYTYTAD